VAGDFNESHSGLYWGKAIEWLEKDQKMRDAIDEFDPNTPSWEWPLPIGKLKANFDHIFYRKSELHCSSAGVKVEGASDHFPVIALFNKKA